MIKNFAIFKNTFKKEGTKVPDYKIMIQTKEEETSLSGGNTSSSIEIGGCWINEGKAGKYFSCRLNDAYIDRSKNIARKGMHLEEDNEEVPANPF